MTYFAIDPVPEPIDAAISLAVKISSAKENRSGEEHYYGLPIWIVREHTGRRVNKVQISTILAGSSLGPEVVFSPDAFDDQADTQRKVAAQKDIARLTTHWSLYQFLGEIDPLGETKPDAPGKAVQMLVDAIEETLARARELELQDTASIKPQPTATVAEDAHVWSIHSRRHGDYRKVKGSSTWHFCRNCASWPSSDYETPAGGSAPQGEICSECLRKEQANRCS